MYCLSPAPNAIAHIGSDRERAYRPLAHRRRKRRPTVQERLRLALNRILARLVGIVG